MDEFAGKVAVITGAASGIGRATAGALAAEGVRLVLADVEEGPLEAAVAQLKATTEVVGVSADVSRYEDVVEVGRVAMDTFGALHIAMNNAGVGSGGLSWDIPLEQWEWVLGVDLWGVIHGVKAFTPLIIASGGGHVVNTASMAGLTSPPFMAPYNVAKHGVVTLSETMFQELAMFHPEVGVSVVCPGWVRTRIHESDRNQPAPDAATAGGPQAPTGADPTATAMFRDTLAGLIAGGIDPDDVAALVLDAIRHRTMYVLTHDDWSSGITDRTARIVAGGDPAMAMLPPND